jgi:RNA polymerase sigma factor (sigma-70 family)
MNDITDVDLVTLARTGNREALGVLLARHYPAALRLCRRLLGNAHDAHDMAQEAALQAVLGLGRLHDPARFGAWLCAIAANLARMALRRRTHLSLDGLTEGAIRVLWPPPVPTPEEIHVAREIHDAVVAALNELPAHEREPAVGFFLEGYSYAELAGLLGVPVSTVKGRLFKSRRRLQYVLAPLASSALAPDRRQRKELLVNDSTMVEVTIASVRRSLWTEHRVVVLREKRGVRALPIWIGAHEADAIALALQGQQPQRPMTHDMALLLLQPLGAQVRRVVVSRILANTFYAEITLALGDQTHVVDARPSDALALAARTGVPVFVAPEVMQQAGTAEEDAVRQDIDAGDAVVEYAGEQVVMERLQQVGQSEGEPVSPFLLATLPYLANFLEPDKDVLGLRFAGVRWDERFPTRALELDGQQLQAVRLHDDARPAWLVLPPQQWEAITHLAQQVIEREQRLKEALRHEVGPGAAPDAEPS